MSFDIAYNEVIGHEGLVSNDKLDSGGYTFMGVARNKQPTWPGWAVIDRMRKNNEEITGTPELLSLVKDFYKTEFWDKLKCNKIDVYSPTVAGELFEASVNCGRSNGVKFLQRAINALNSRGKLYPDLKVDGEIGTKTLNAIVSCLKSRPTSLLYKCQNGEQYIHYKQWSKHEDFPGVFKRIC